MNKNDIFFLVEIFFEYLYAFYSIQKNTAISSPGIDKTEQYNPYIDTIMKNFLDVIK